MDSYFSSAILAGVVILLSYAYYSIKNKGILPGPIGVPYLGLYPFLTDENYFLKLDEYKKKYGDIFSFTYTGRLYINMGSIKVMREILLNKGDCFMEKIKDTNLAFEMLQKGIGFENGKTWRILRKFFIIKLKEYGLNAIQDNMVGTLYDSLKITIEDLKKVKGKSINILEFLEQRASATVLKIILGENAVTDDILDKMIISFTNSFEDIFGTKLLLIGPVARFLFAIKPSFRKSFNYHKMFTNLLLDCVRKIENSMDEESPTCVVEEYYIERNKRRRKNDPTWRIFSDEALVNTLIQVVGDGIQFVAAFISGILNVLLNHPDDQEKMYSEMLEMIGPNRQPSAEDRPNLPYINAFINESIRHTNLNNFLPTLECTSEATYRGFRIPVGSILLYNFRSAHHDPDTYRDPHIFNPSRYLSTSGEQKEEPPVIFGMGKRVCIAESFVMLQTFLFVATIVKNFKIVASNAPQSNSANFLIAGKLELTFAPRT